MGLVLSRIISTTPVEADPLCSQERKISEAKADHVRSYCSSTGYVKTARTLLDAVFHTPTLSPTPIC
ncbi:hypothetical protein Y1Q_0018297 [Alligator mississippiensis]|uniref:Uncharacterized protein n=1 Tax=Alligator mississippiensis TaxID=8496 RepID=A0A151PBR9_ALLMI|nr:hypothetical protein Y1Q_0018297 [Alligator mississippiensis]